MVNTVGGTGSTSGGDDAGHTNRPAAAQDVSKEAFMQLLVAQIKNQNPLNPTDGVQFLSQLAQFSELEQLININSELSGVRELLTPAKTGDQNV